MLLPVINLALSTVPVFHSSRIRIFVSLRKVVYHLPVWVRKVWFCCWGFFFHFMQLGSFVGLVYETLFSIPQRGKRKYCPVESAVGCELSPRYFCLFCFWVSVGTSVLVALPVWARGLLPFPLSHAVCFTCRSLQLQLCCSSNLLCMWFPLFDISVSCRPHFCGGMMSDSWEQT